MQWKASPASRPGVEGTRKYALLTITMNLNATWYQLLKAGSVQCHGPFCDIIVGPDPPHMPPSSEVLGSSSFWSHSYVLRYS